MDPNFSVGRWRLGEAYEQKGMYEEAIAEFQRAISLSKDPSIRASLGHAYAVSGQKYKAQRILGELKRKHKRDFQWFYQIAIVYEALGERDQAFEWLERGAEPEKGSTLLKVDPIVDSLRSDPRFGKLLDRMGLGE